MNTRARVTQRKKLTADSIGDQGFMLLGLIVAIFLILLVLGMAAPKMARNLRRDREVEAVHRGNQYVRAIREYYVKFQHYPGSMEQLEKTNNIRFLRQKYKDPINGKEDWRIIPVGQNKTTVKGFFGQPLAGLATTGLGSAAGMASPGIGQTPGGSTAFGGSGGSGGPGANAGAQGAAAGPGTPGTPTTPGATGSPTTPGSTDSLPGLFGTGSGLSGAGGSGSIGPFMGVGLSATGDAVIELNEQKTYDAWEFLYDPRIELLKAKALLNGSAGSVGAGSLGQTPGSIGGPPAPGPGGNTNPAGGTNTPAQPVFGAPNQP
jgi:type II secretory pathway pseudopilin PulG